MVNLNNKMSLPDSAASIRFQQKVVRKLKQLVAKIRGAAHKRNLIGVHWLTPVRNSVQTQRVYTRLVFPSLHLTQLNYIRLVRSKVEKKVNEMYIKEKKTRDTEVKVKTGTTLWLREIKRATTDDVLTAASWFNGLTRCYSIKWKCMLTEMTWSVCVYRPHTRHRCLAISWYTHSPQLMECTDNNKMCYIFCLCY